MTHVEMEHRTVVVPDGLAGERLDTALARMFGFSRSRAAELIGAGHVRVDGAEPAKSLRVDPGAMLDVDIPSETDAVAVVPQAVEGIKIIHDDDALVVIDKPVGVAVHPSPGWRGPTADGHSVETGLPVQWDAKFGLVKVNPLINWDEKRVWAYIFANEVPYNPLHDHGYPSIGCTNCTKPVNPGDDPRSGRWAGLDKNECGLHTEP